MKHPIPLIILTLFALNASAQMHVKKFNLTSFHNNEKVSSKLLAEKSSPEAKQHPEYGILPFNSQCSECIELIDKRTIASRLFIDPKNEGHTYSQQSYFPLHYQKDAGDIWRTIDSRLRPQTTGIYVASNQPVPTKCDLNRKSTSLTEHGFEFEFNKNLSLFFFDDNTLYTQKTAGDYSNYTIGEEGLNVKNIWPGIEMEQLFTVGQVKTNFIIAAPLQLPVSAGWMVIEDHFTLPENISFVEEGHGDHLPGGYYRGDYLVKNEKGETLFTYEKPVYIDAKVLGMHGVYNLLKNGSDYTLQTLIPVEWLKKTDNTYPLMIDPSVYGATKMGDFTSTGLPSANMAFTSMSLGACQYHMVVDVPGKSQLTNAYVDLEYSLTYDNTCGTPPLPPPFCTFSQVSMEVLCDTCGTTTGMLSCHPSSPPYTGTCTTDSNIVPGANAVLVNNFVPNYISCLPPQCPDYFLGFTLHNRDSICGDMCGYLCARGNMWRITVEAQRVEGYITQNASTACLGDSVLLTAHPAGGVPPYHFAWSDDLGATWDTIYGSVDYVILPQHSLSVGTIIYDNCSEPWPYNNNLDITMPNPPTISTSGDTLFSSSPTGNQWYLNDTAIAGATDAQYILTQVGNCTVRVTDSTGCQSPSSYPVNIVCSAHFTIVPSPWLGDSGVYYGLNQSVGLNTSLSYLWDFGDSTTSTDQYPEHTYSQPGLYMICLTVTGSGCSHTFCDSSFYVFKTEGGLMSKLIIQGPNGIKESDKDALIRVFPNPATNELNIVTGGKPIEELRIFATDGKLVVDLKHPTGSRFDVKNLAPGVYVADLKLKGSEYKVRWLKM